MWGCKQARKERGDDGDDEHDDWIEKLRGRDEDILLNHAIVYAKGKYEYQTQRKQDTNENPRREVEQENSERWRDHEHVKSHHNKQNTSDTVDEFT